MLIRSNFKDCYDSVQKLGSDHDVVYNRKTIRCIDDGDYRGVSVGIDTRRDIKHPHKILSYNDSVKQIPSLKLLTDICKNNNVEVNLDKRIRGYTSYSTTQLLYFLRLHNYKKKYGCVFTKGVFFFCGKIYNLLVVYKYYDETYSAVDIEYIYDKEKLSKYITNNELISLVITDKQIEESLFNWLGSPNDKFKDELIVNKVISVLYIIHQDKGFCNRFNKDISILDLIINPSLEDIRFTNVLPPTLIFQELDTYISGTLTYPQNAMIEVSDEQKVIKHGFDTKYGFRKRKNT